jgi:hypothetical protein
MKLFQARLTKQIFTCKSADISNVYVCVVKYISLCKYIEHHVVSVCSLLQTLQSQLWSFRTLLPVQMSWSCKQPIHICSILMAMQNAV